MTGHRLSFARAVLSVEQRAAVTLNETAPGRAASAWLKAPWKVSLPSGLREEGNTSAA